MITDAMIEAAATVMLNSIRFGYSKRARTLDQMDPDHADNWRAYAKAALEAAERAAWRPIEEAKKDDGMVDLWTTYGCGDRVTNARWSSRKDSWVVWGPDDYGDLGLTRVQGIVTHFRYAPNGPSPALLPSPPEDPSKKGEA